ncbi:ABC transporter ATP-binding protein [Corynebacterium sp.]|uniref:ABC transporter ATP-binding protein n=1 Tax=Corynebacterium sp. TaxID=1720 RepID=UPI0026DFE14D|nr:ABC transporter ATP-binding protein [Corynebacterium sp.]MDO5511126.1 ABC transporter ATP-binding protein [Corynebacterium sp.]
MSREDALAPASVRETGRTLRALPTSPGPAWLLGTTAVFVLAVAAMTVSATLLGRAVDIADGPWEPFVWLLSGVAAALLVETAARSVGGWLLTARTRMMSVDLRRQALGSVLRAPVPDVLELGTGNVITRLTQDIDTVVRMMSATGIRLAVTILMFPVTLVALVLVHPLFALSLVLTLAVVYPLLRLVLPRMPQAANIVATAEARRNAILLDTVRSLPTLRALRLGPWALERTRRASWDAVQARADRAPLFVHLLGYGNIAYVTLLASTLGLATWLVSRGDITIGAATAAMVLVVRLEGHVFNLLFLAGDIQEAGTSLGRAVALARLAPTDSRDIPDDLEAPPEIRIEHLRFSYPGGADILPDITVTLPAGSTTALVGASGAGKSTLAGLLAGLQRPDSGRILINGVDTAEVDDAWTTRQVTLLTQDVHLFSGALRDDLLMAAPHAGDEMLIDALAATGLAPGTATWARHLPRGLDTPVGAGTDSLPPEVAQQVALARVILRDPPVLIMDEATSEAGSDDARTLERAATAAARGRTSLIVAHRLDQAMVADRILVMDAGRIVEEGTHAELLDAAGRYAELYSRWS